MTHLWFAEAASNVRLSTVGVTAFVERTPVSDGISRSMRWRPQARPSTSKSRQTRHAPEVRLLVRNLARRISHCSSARARTLAAESARHRSLRARYRAPHTTIPRAKFPGVS